MSIKKKIKNLNVGGFIEGFANKATGKNTDIAIERSLICYTCPSMVVEPIDEFRIIDEDIPTISGKMCNECGCALPYLLRQTKKTCKLGKW